MSLHCFFDVPARTPEPAQSERHVRKASQRLRSVPKERPADGVYQGRALFGSASDSGSPR